MSEFYADIEAEETPPEQTNPQMETNEDTSFLDIPGDNDPDEKKTERLHSTDEIDFEKELMAIRASEDDDLEGVVSNSSATKTEVIKTSESNTTCVEVSSQNETVDDDEIQRLLQESDNNDNDDDFLSSNYNKHKSSASKTSIAIMNCEDNSQGPDVSMPPDGIMENEDGTFSCYVIVPAGKAGMVIGTAGSTVKQMMAESKTRMNLVQDSTQNTGADKPLRIVGERECVLKAKDMVLHLINEGGAPSFVDLHVPKFAVGMIIGNRGATINKLQDEYGVRIQIKPDQNPEGRYRVCQILGEPTKYQNAAQKVLDLVAAVEAKDKARGSGSKSSGGGGGGGGDRKQTGDGDGSGAKTYKHEVHMTVHERAVGRIIGKGGANIKRMMNESNCKIEMDKNNVNSKNGRVVFILSSTSMNSIEEAQDLINEAAKRPDNMNNGNRDGNTNYYGGIGSPNRTGRVGSNGSGSGSRESSGNRSLSRGFENRDDSRGNRFNNSGNFNDRNSFRKRASDFRNISPDMDDTSRTKVIKTEIYTMHPMGQRVDHQQQMNMGMNMGMMSMSSPMPPNNFMPPMMPHMMAPSNPMMNPPSTPKPMMPPGFPPMMAPPGMPGMPPFPMPGMPPSPANMPPVMQPPPTSMSMPPMPQPPMSQPSAPVNPMPTWPGFPPMPVSSQSSSMSATQQSSSNTMPASGNPFEMWMQYAAKMAGGGSHTSGGGSQSSVQSNPVVAPAPSKPQSGSSGSSNSGSNNSQDAWMKCYKIFMDTMQDKGSSSGQVKKEPEVKKEPVSDQKKDYTKEWQEYMAKLYAAGGAGSQMEAWKKWTEKYQEYLKTHSNR